MSYRTVRSSISFIVGFISSLVIVFFNFSEPDPLIFGISAFAGFIIFTSVTWSLTGLLLTKLPDDNIQDQEQNLEHENSDNLLDVTIDDESEAQDNQEEEPEEKPNNPLLETLGPDGKIDWEKLAPADEDGLLNDFVPLDIFQKNS